LAQSGFSGDNGVETVLGEVYADRPTRGLETADAQIALLANMAGRDQLSFLMSALESLEEAGPTLLRVADAWADGDVESIETELLAGMRRDYPDVFDAVFTDRNRAWADIIDAELKGSGTDFIAVGAGHLVGEDSVQDFLEGKGYTVRRIDLSDD
ncbi:MAG: TraB/GumN family protein, partial [Litorimonas sp.]